MSITPIHFRIGSVVETYVVPEVLHSTAPPMGATGEITKKEGDLCIVAFPLTFVVADGSIQFGREACQALQLTYAQVELRAVDEKVPCATRLVVIRLDDREYDDGEWRYGYDIHDVTHSPDLPSVMMQSVRRRFLAGSGLLKGLLSDSIHARKRARNGMLWPCAGKMGGMSMQSKKGGFSL